MAQANDFGDSLAQLIESYPRQLGFPLGAGLPIPTETEREVMSAIQRAMPVSQEALVAVRGSVGLQDAYDLLTFSVRTAIYSARTRTPELLKVTALCVMLDDGQLDYRDVLRALGLIEACANDLNVNFDEVMLSAVGFATPQRRELIVDGYLARTPSWRGPEVMGFIPSGTGEHLTFVKT